MSFFHKKMSQNFWATIMPFGPAAIISGTGIKHHNPNPNIYKNYFSK